MKDRKVQRYALLAITGIAIAAAARVGAQSKRCHDGDTNQHRDAGANNHAYPVNHVAAAVDSFRAAGSLGSPSPGPIDGCA